MKHFYLAAIYQKDFGHMIAKAPLICSYYYSKIYKFSSRSFFDQRNQLSVRKSSRSPVIKTEKLVFSNRSHSIYWNRMSYLVRVSHFQIITPVWVLARTRPWLLEQKLYGLGRSPCLRPRVWNYCWCASYPWYRLSFDPQKCCEWVIHYELRYFN
jgi:hypothetical protein